MKIIIVSGATPDSSHYLAEILHAFGICCATRMSAHEALRSANSATDLLIFPTGSDTGELESFLQTGGNAIVVRPTNDVAVLAGLEPTAELENPSRLRLVTPICPGARCEPLWTLGPRTIYKSQSPSTALAYLFEPGEPDSECVGIVQCSVGKGTLVAFAYDPATCIARLRQGLPERANYLPPGDAVPRSVHLHQPDAPQDAAWRPTADLHAVALCNIVNKLLSATAPVPALWHIPAGHPAALIFSGDEDGAPQEDTQHEMNDVESFGGRMSLYVIPGETSITPQHIENYEQRGHSISVHPDLISTRGKSPAEQLAKAEADVLLFKEKFDQPVRTVRNHCTMWPGYVDVPELWERLGIGMDANCFATRYRHSPDWGPYVNVDAAVPLPFMREDGSVIDVYQQPTQLNDDLLCHPEVDYSMKYTPEQYELMVRRIFEDATRFFCAPLCANFHPWSYARYSTRHGQAAMRVANEFGIPIWSLDRWHNFWRARASWQMSQYSWQNSRLAFTLTGSPCEQLSITLPPGFNGHNLSNLSMNGNSTIFQIVERFQQSTAVAVLPADAHEVNVVAQYN